MAARSGGLNTVVDRLFYTKQGSILFSGIIGLAIALLFSRVCKDKKCMIIHAPPMDEMKNNVYKLDSECYKYTAVPAECDDSDSNKVASQ